MQRLKTVEALLARIVDLQREPDVSAKADFHKLVGDLEALGRRRNDFVHSKYMQWRNVEGSLGLIRQNSKLRKGIREEQEEELQPEAFNADIDNIECVLRKLEAFRLRILDWLYPDVVPVKP